MAKHFDLKINNGAFEFSRNQDRIRREEELDGLYVIRTSEPAARLAAAQAVRGYKSLAHVERAFRCLKGLDLMVRPIFLRTEDHVRAHIFLCLLAYYVEWHMRQALAPLLFADEEVENDRKTRDPVAPAQPSPSAKEKRALQRTPEGMLVHSFRTLLHALSTRCRNVCRLKAEPTSTFIEITEPDPLQARVLKLLGL